MTTVTDADYVARAARPGSIAAYALLFAGEQRGVLGSLLALRAEIAESSLGHQDHGVAHARLAWWQQELERLAAGRPQHPITRSLAAAAGARRPDWAPLQRLLGAASLELARVTFADDAELDLYLGAASAPLHALAATLAVDTAGTAPAAARFGTDLGAALRLIEIIDTLRHEAPRGFIALPQSWLTSANLTVEAVQSGRDPAIATVLERAAALAGSRLRAALAALPREQRAGVTGQLALAAGYTLRLADWRRRRFDPASAPPALRPLATLWTCWRAARRLDLET
jgi:phytoene synthase